MKLIHLDCHYLIHKIDRHSEIKDELLSLINNAQNKRVTDECSETDIARADWFKASDFTKRDWVQFIKPHLIPTIMEMIHKLGFDGFKMWEIWFQQYFNKNGHGWHTHSANWTNVYYLELPDNAPKTQLVNPFTKDIINIDIKEGDVLMFPSFVLHRAPPIDNDDVSGCRKTIISYNLDTLYSNEIYGQSINFQ